MSSILGTHRIDVDYLGQPRAILASVLETPAGLLVIDPGPARSLDGLGRGMAAAGLALADVHALLLTHIHLDHAGAAGTLVARFPYLHVYVHERGAPHLVDPSKLLASANRIYGDALGRLFGVVVPVPAGNVTAFGDADRLDFGGRTVRSVHAPGHAWHHVAYFDEAAGTVYVGDTAGERFEPAEFVLPVTPPPDIDLLAWRTTLARIRAWRPAEIALTHFGVFPDVERHLAEFEQRLEHWAVAVRDSLGRDTGDEERAAAFVQDVRAELSTAVSEPARAHYQNGGIRDSWYGLARYWRKQ